MAWREVKVEEARKKFIQAYLEKKLTMAELCRQFDISRKNGYKWVERFKTEGLDGLRDKSRKPIKQARETPLDIVDDILSLKFEFPKWGPKKIKGDLENRYPEIEWPSVTTMQNILYKNGLIIPRKLRKRLSERTSPLAHCQQCNDIWCLDFKGWFLTKDNQKCEPFTLMDAHSRYLLSCVKLQRNDNEHVWAILDKNFREYGLPLRVRSDNGSPFATIGAGRLSKLSINLIKANVIPEWIEPGKPQQNGRHERMHLTLKQEGIFPDNLSLEEQQMKFSKFLEYYNFTRPHEALNQKYPGDIYCPSKRTWNGRLKSPEYSHEYKICKVHSCGKIRWKGNHIYIGRVLSGEPVGLKENQEGLSVYYGPIFLGIIDDGMLKILRRKTRIKRKIKQNNASYDTILVPEQSSRDPLLCEGAR